MKENADLSPSLVAVDWGSTNFRATLVIDGEVVERVESAHGIRHRNGRDYDDLLFSLVGHWFREHPKLDLVLSGMIGSREGWHEVPYVAGPAGIGNLAAGMATVSSRHFDSVRIVPGVRWDDPVSGTTDVMRGEETQVAGLLHSLPTEGPATICLPGTHSKWIVCREGKIERFRTFLTGEAFDRLTRDSLIAGDGKTGADPESAAFARGVELSTQAGGGLLHHLFLGRAEMLTGRVSAGDLPGLVSGLLVGHEIREARAFAEGPVVLVGRSPAAEATARAAKLLGLEARREEEDGHLRGLLAIAATAPPRH